MLICCMSIIDFEGQTLKVKIRMRIFFWNDFRNYEGIGFEIEKVKKKTCKGSSNQC